MKNHAAVGYWVIAITPGQELIKWGQDGGTVHPYTQESEARDQIAYLKEDENNDDRLYILKLFSNGDMVTIEVD